MTDRKIPDFKALENSIIDVIKEEQIKLGYRSETIRLYYPSESIQKLLGKEYDTSTFNVVLDGFCDSVKERLGEVIHSHQGSRYCFVIPAIGVTFVHEKVEENYFLVEFINKMNHHGCTLEEILDLFNRYSDKVVFEKTNHGEFDYLIYFEDGIPDRYRYCLKFEHGHAIYHRFTKDDYESFDFD